MRTVLSWAIGHLPKWNSDKDRGCLDRFFPYLVSIWKKYSFHVTNNGNKPLNFIVRESLHTRWCCDKKQVWFVRPRLPSAKTFTQTNNMRARMAEGINLLITQIMVCRQSRGACMHWRIFMFKVLLSCSSRLSIFRRRENWTFYAEFLFHLET